MTRTSYLPRSGFVTASVGIHVLGLLLLISFPDHWRPVITVIVADHLLLVGGSLWPRSTLVGPNLRSLTEAGAKDAIALTFDDGPDPQVTPEVLRILDEHGASATFFCIGSRAERNPDLVAEISRRGHRVENHSHNHFNHFCLLGPRSLAREIDRAQDAILRCNGERPRYFRAPAGLRNPWLDSVLVARRLNLVSWSRRGFDTVTLDANRVVRRLVDRIGPGDIIVLHDGSSARGEDGRPVVLEALPVVLGQLERRGLRAIAIPRPGRG